MAITQTPSQRRMSENQVVFRAANEPIQNWFGKFLKLARRETNGTTDLSAAQHITFMCECSDENCTERINVPYNVYKRVHRSPDEFTIALGHEVPEIEDITRSERGYCVVRKHVVPDQTQRVLHATNVDNS